MTNTPHPPEPTARTPQTHELKCWPAFFVAVQSWDKMFEIRHNDRDFKVGDVLWLREWNAENYTGESVKRTISYITDFPSGLRDGYVCMGLAYPDLPAMAQRVVELEQMYKEASSDAENAIAERDKLASRVAELESFQINFQHAMNIEREEAKAERDKLAAEVEYEKSLSAGYRLAADKLAARVDELHDSLSLAKRQRDDVAAQVEELANRTLQQCRETFGDLDTIDDLIHQRDELRKALAEAMELIRQADADPHIAYSPEWGAKATKFVLVAGTDQAG